MWKASIAIQSIPLPLIPIQLPHRNCGQFHLMNWKRSNSSLESHQHPQNRKYYSIYLNIVSNAVVVFVLCFSWSFLFGSWGTLWFTNHWWNQRRFSEHIFMNQPLSVCDDGLHACALCPWHYIWLPALQTWNPEGSRFLSKGMTPTCHTARE